MGKTTIAYFSATGNTLYVAKRVKDAELVSIDAINNGDAVIPEDTDRLGIFTPVHAFGLPLPVRVFIRKYLASRNNDNIGYIFHVNTNGGMPTTEPWIMEKELQEIGLGLSYTASIKMPDGYLPFLKSSPDVNRTREMKAEAEAKIQRVLEDIEKEEIELPKRIPFSILMRKLSLKANQIHPVDSKMAITKECIGCGVCTRICPMDNIVIENGKALYGDRCISCFACYHRCPTGAITYGKVIGQYQGIVETKELFKR
ncbi:MAG: EFR1 family ferrodoxin [Spirochaetales bacterium]|nr:EFR1 family ferrodoxin [Candidatus Physcosoma equi]